MSDAPSPAVDSYDEVPYPSAPYRLTHPSSIAALARLFGMDAPDPARARVLELGCASGGNLVPMAQDLPDARFLGIDLSARQVAEGQEFVAQLGLTNIELRRQSILDFDAEPRSFDYILCHGVYSWVPRPVQDKILGIAARCLSPAGVIYVSYNTYPGWYLRGIVRDMMQYHAASFPDPQSRIRQARELLRFLAKTAQGRTAAYNQVLRDEAEIIDSTSDSYLYHEHLETVNEPLYFYQFVERLGTAGLQYLAETDLPGMLSENLAPEISALFEKTPLLRQEQYLDFLTNRMFRCTLACRAEVALERQITPDRLRQLWLAVPGRLEAEPIAYDSEEPTRFQESGRTVTAKAPITKAALAKLNEVWPRSLPFDELFAQAGERIISVCGVAPADLEFEKLRLAADLLRLLARGVLKASVSPPDFVTSASPQPRATLVARRQAATRGVSTNRLHRQVALEPLARVVLPLLDGAHDRGALAQAIRAANERGDVQLRLRGEPLADPDDETLARLVERTLNELAQQALLIG
ncbi:MAG: class I SAM-dependent methyltransferase [Planctomycetaceae bacterium]|nr:class I SAM-dependent methyltransferase [Planctomycetaceae bacterium]